MPNSNVCAVCGRPSRYIFAFPSGEASADGAPVYDGAPVCSPECAQELARRRQEAQERQELAPAPPSIQRALDRVYADYERLEREYGEEEGEELAGDPGASIEGKGEEGEQ